MMNTGDGKPSWCARSDARMNRALEARLGNPNLSLYECLRIGGFNYSSDDANAVDEENVTLAQRKNQLNRRVRTFRNRASGRGGRGGGGGGGKAKEAPAKQAQQAPGGTAGLSPVPAVAQSATRALSAAGAPGPLSLRGISSIIHGNSQEASWGAGDMRQAQHQGQQANTATGMQSQSQSQSAELASNWESLFAQALSSGALSAQNTSAGNSTLPILQSAPTDQQQQPIDPRLASALAVYQQQFRALTDQTGYSQQQQNQQNQQNQQQIGQTTHHPQLQELLHQSTGANTASFPAIYPPPPALDMSSVFAQPQLQQMSLPAAIQASDPRRTTALRLFEQQIQTLYDNSMALAGFGPEERQPASVSYQAFVLLASRGEWERAQRDVTGSYSNSNTAAADPSNYPGGTGNR